MSQRSATSEVPTRRKAPLLKNRIVRPRNFSGISLSAYKRLLGSAIEAASKSGRCGARSVGELTEAGLAPHLAKVYSIWSRQQKLSMEKTIEMLGRKKSWLAVRKKTFSALRERVGEEKLDSLFRIDECGEIVFDPSGGGPTLSAKEKEACLSMYPLYTLVLGAPRELKVKLATALALKLS
jgi:hypothetical protein